MKTLKLILLSLYIINLASCTNKKDKSARTETRKTKYIKTEIEKPADRSLLNKDSIVFSTSKNKYIFRRTIIS